LNLEPQVRNAAQAAGQAFFSVAKAHCRLEQVCVAPIQCYMCIANFMWTPASASADKFIARSGCVDSFLAMC
jgi:hypothetical protein